MKILFDQGVPAPLRRWLSDEMVATAAEQGWSHLSNGVLISTSEEAGFDVLVTTDRNLKYQQNLSHRKMAIAVVLCPAWPVLKQRAEEVAVRIRSLGAGAYEEI